MKRRIVLVGFGRIASRHVEAIAELSEVAEVVAVIEPREDRRLAAGQQLGVPTFSDLDGFRDSNVACDLISILVDSGSHFEVAMKAACLGVPVLVEKPMTLSLSDARKLVRTFHSQGTPLFVVKQNRLNPPVEEVFRGLQNGDLGRLLFANASVLWARDAAYYLEDDWRMHRSSDGGVIWNQASHYVDLMVLALGEVESVFAVGQNYLSPADSEDTVFAIFRSKSGAVGSLQATTAARPRNFEGSFTLGGEKGTARIGGHALNELVAWTPAATSMIHEENQLEPNNVYGKSHSKLYSDLFLDLAGGALSQFRAENGLQVIAVMEAISRSILTKKEQKVDFQSL